MALEVRQPKSHQIIVFKNHQSPCRCWLRMLGQALKSPDKMLNGRKLEWQFGVHMKQASFGVYGWV